jgi:hypothetical protein
LYFVALQRENLSSKPKDFWTFSTYIFSQEFSNADQGLQTLSGTEDLNCDKKITETGQETYRTTPTPEKQAYMQTKK